MASLAMQNTVFDEQAARAARRRNRPRRSIEVSTTTAAEPAAAAGKPKDLVEGARVRVTLAAKGGGSPLAEGGIVEGTLVENQKRNGALKILVDGQEKPTRVRYKDLDPEVAVEYVETGGTGAPSPASGDAVAKRVRAAKAIELPDKPEGYDAWAEAVHRGESVEVDAAQVDAFRDYALAAWERHQVKSAENGGAIDVDLLEQVLRVAPDAARKGELADMARDVRRMRELRQQFDKRGLAEKDRKAMLALEERFGIRGSAAKKGGAGAKATGGSKQGGSRSGGGSRPKYPIEITEAVKKAKEIRGTDKGAPGAKQHVAVREAVAAASGMGGSGGATADGLLEYLDMTERALREAASGKMPTDKLRGQEGLKKVAHLPALAEDPKLKPWCQGRNLASMLAAWHAALKAAK